MLIITKQQFAELEEAVRDQFIRELLVVFPNSNFSELMTLLLEALGYKIDEEDVITDFIRLSFESEAFRSKPSWIMNTLKNENYPAHEKIQYIKSNLHLTNEHE